MVRPMADKHWGKARTEGIVPCKISGSPARRSLAAHQAAEPMQRTFRSKLVEGKRKIVISNDLARLKFDLRFCGFRFTSEAGNELIVF